MNQKIWETPSGSLAVTAIVLVAVLALPTGCVHMRVSPNYFRLLLDESVPFSATLDHGKSGPSNAAALPFTPSTPNSASEVISRGNQ
jgi:hypothetical protein